MTKVVVQVPATTANLGPGFDALGMALDVWNKFEFEFSGPTVQKVEEATVHVRCTGEGSDHLPGDEKNLVFKALVMGLESLPLLPATIDIRVHNEVPLSSGLGSSATAIVGGLAAAQALRGKDMSNARMIQLASQMEGHPDNVAPAVLGGFVVSVSELDGPIHSISIQPPEELRICLAVPDFFLTTHHSRSRLPERISREDAVFSLSRSSLWVAAIATGRLEALSIATQDVLHQPYRSELIPGLHDVFAAARSAGALGVALSGAGPSVVAFCREDALNIIGDEMQRAFRKVGVTARIIKTGPSTRGTQIHVNTLSSA